MKHYDLAKQRLNYDPETGVFTYYGGRVAGTVNAGGYLQIGVKGKKVILHRLAYYINFGVLPDRVDHKDRNKQHNAKDNLRDATCVENAWNSDKHWDNTSGFKGVSMNSKKTKWRARINVNGKSIETGPFDTKEEAAESYRVLVETHCGEYGYTGKEG